MQVTRWFAAVLPTGPVWRVIAASRTKPPARLPESADCQSGHNNRTSRGGDKRAAADTAGANNTLDSSKLGSTLRGVLNAVSTARYSGSSTGPGGSDMLWVGPASVFTAPMDVSSREKHMKVKQVCTAGSKMHGLWTRVPHCKIICCTWRKKYRLVDALQSVMTCKKLPFANCCSLNSCPCWSIPYVDFMIADGPVSPWLVMVFWLYHTAVPALAVCRDGWTQ